MYFYSLNRRVRALTANTFGSQDSAINKFGLNTAALPTTNQFALQGSNPVWTTEDVKQPDLDAQSIGSGGSVLIGAEDEEYFAGNNNNNEEKNGNYNYSENETDSSSSSGADYQYLQEERPSNATTDDFNPFASSEVTRRNPLANLHLDGNDGLSSDL